MLILAGTEDRYLPSAKYAWICEWPFRPVSHRHTAMVVLQAFWPCPVLPIYGIRIMGLKCVLLLSRRVLFLWDAPARTYGLSEIFGGVSLRVSAFVCRSWTCAGDKPYIRFFRWFPDFLPDTFFKWLSNREESGRHFSALRFFHGCNLPLSGPNPLLGVSRIPTAVDTQRKKYFVETISRKVMPGKVASSCWSLKCQKRYLVYVKTQKVGRHVHSTAMFHQFPVEVMFSRYPWA